MKLSDFDYPVPEDRIAQRPLKERDGSRLFIAHRSTGKFEHRLFRDITGYLNPGDVLVLNDTKVIPVRIPGTKPSGGKAEITLLEELAKNSWEALVKGIHEGEIILDQGITARVSRLNGTLARVDFHIHDHNRENGKPDIRDFLHDIGVMPLPVYIKRASELSDTEQYQTVYARNEGAVAAPTAGLHFTDRLLTSLRDKGIEVMTVTLHVGYGTFRLVTAENVREHRMDEESFEIPEATADAVNSAKSDGRRVVAVGTTVTRALETSARKNSAHRIGPGRDRASIFIYPGFSFRIVDALLTNFHLPKSTPMMLASAFSGLALLKEAYSVAQHEGYRFYSYGDAMLML